MKPLRHQLSESDLQKITIALSYSTNLGPVSGHSKTLSNLSSESIYDQKRCRECHGSASASDLMWLATTEETFVRLFTDATRPVEKGGVAEMQGLELSSTDLTEIVKVLKGHPMENPSPEKRFRYFSPRGTRTYVASVLRRSFLPPGPLTERERALSEIISQVEKNAIDLGGSCSRYDRFCLPQDTSYDLIVAAPQEPVADAVRTATISRACSSLLGHNEGLKNLLDKASIPETAPVSEAQLTRLHRVFFPFQRPTQKLIQTLTWAYHGAISKGLSNQDAWRAISLPLCESASDNLTGLDLYSRCFSQLTQTSVSANDPRALAVAAHKKDPIDACMEVLDLAQFSNAGTEIADRKDPLAIAVLFSMNKLHASFFQKREYHAVGFADPGHGTSDIYDSETPGFYFTRALFNSAVPFRSVVTSDKHLIAVRTENSLSRGARTGRTRAETVFSEALPYASVGELFGITPTGEQLTHYRYTDKKGVQREGDVMPGLHFGGGVLGSPVYLVQTVADFRSFRSNGAKSMPRRWAASVLHDLLCRDPQAVRHQDAKPWVRTDSHVNFRTQANCLQCHAPLDRLAAVIRGFRYISPGIGDSTSNGADFAGFATPVPLGTTPLSPENPQDDASRWPAEPDLNYFLREPIGNLFYRNSKGKLIDQQVHGLSELGEALAEQEDLYLCTVKRYYSYFMGIDVPIGDVTQREPKTAIDQVHSNNLIRLSQGLRKHQSLRSLVRDIFRLPEYRSGKTSSM